MYPQELENGVAHPIWSPGTRSRSRTGTSLTKVLLRLSSIEETEVVSFLATPSSGAIQRVEQRDVIGGLDPAMAVDHSPCAPDQFRGAM
jgi:hypothetical protein